MAKSDGSTSQIAHCCRACSRSGVMGPMWVFHFLFYLSILNQLGKKFSPNVLANQNRRPFRVDESGEVVRARQSNHINQLGLNRAQTDPFVHYWQFHQRTRQYHATLTSREALRRTQSNSNYRRPRQSRQFTRAAFGKSTTGPRWKAAHWARLAIGIEMAPSVEHLKQQHRQSRVRKQSARATHTPMSRQSNWSGLKSFRFFKTFFKFKVCRADPSEHVYPTQWGRLTQQSLNASESLSW